MDRRTRTVVVVGVALLTATIASTMVYRAVRRIPVRQVEVAHEFVVVAARPVPLGARLSRGDVKLVGWPSSSPLAGTYSRIEDVVGRGAIAAIAENEAIVQSKLASADAGAGLPPVIPPGMRAISVKVNEVIGVAGFVVPGTRVDVIVTVKRTDDAVTRVLVANVPVLAAGTRYEQEKARDVKPIPATVVTVVVTPADAEKIALAAAEGQLTLMLRNPVDRDQPETPGAHLARLVEPPALPPPVKAPRPAAPRPIVQPEVVAAVAAPPSVPTSTIEAIRAGQRSEVILK